MTNLHFAPGVSLIPLLIHTRGRICKYIPRVATNCKSSYSSIALHRIKYPLLPASIRYSYNVFECRRLPIFQLRNFSSNNSSEDKKTEEVEKPKDESISWKDKSIYWSKEYQTIPNYITMSRILASPLLTYTVMYDMKISALVGVALFGFTDWLDGFLAKKLNQQTTIGAFLDPLADKIMIGSLSLGLMLKGLLPMELGVLIISRDAFLMVFSIVLRLIDKPSESGFWDVRSATFKVIPNEMSKINTAVQFGLLSLTLSNFAMGYPAIEVIEPFWWITATTTLWSWAAYLDGSGVSYFNLKEKAKRKAKEMMKSTR